MRTRAVTGALATLTGTLWVSGALAVGPQLTPIFQLAPAPTVSLDRSGRIANLSLGSVVAPGFVQDASTLRPNSIAVARGLQLELSRARNWDPYADLFLAGGTLNQSYLSGTTTRASATMALGHDVTFSASHVALALGALSEGQPSDFTRDLAARLGTDVRSIGTTSATLNWNFSSWGGLGITASRSNASPLLSDVPALRGAAPAESTALGISARVGFGEGWVTTLAYAEGVTQLGLNRNRPGLGGDSVQSQGYGIGLAKTGLFGDDALGIALSRPLQIYTGTNNFGALNTNFALANTQARESDVALGYVTTFLDGTLALQANAAYQLNAAGTRGQNAVAGVARAKLNF
jgi:hypothetical protein